MSDQELMVKKFENVEVFFMEDGYINATQVAKGYNEKPDNWLTQERTKKIIDSISRSLDVEKGKMVIVRRGSPETGGGTWLHFSLRDQFERWLHRKDLTRDVVKDGLSELYVVLFDTGVLKIGKGNSGIARVKSHISQASCFGVKTVKFFIEKNPTITEEELILFCNQKGTLHHGNEYFKDLEYDAVVNFIKRKIERKSLRLVQ